MSLISQLGQMFLADAKKAALPDVQSFFQDMAQNGISVTGVPMLGKALVAVEADGIAGLNQFAKDAGSLIAAYIGALLNPPPAAPKPAGS